MKIAVPTDGAFVANHFGRCEKYTLVTIESGSVVEESVIDNPGHEPGFLPKFLGEKGVNCIVASGMGQRALTLFEEQGIETVLGCAGRVEDIVKAFCEGTLSGGESTCSHNGDGDEEHCHTH